MIDGEPNLMNVKANLLLLLGYIASAAYSQSTGGVGNDGSVSPPKSGCGFDRTHAIVMRVKEYRPWKLPNPLEKTIQFRVGTVVSVSRREQSWSCVTGSIETLGVWTTRAGWMRSSQLEALPH
jgi:hypothetical protein